MVARKHYNPAKAAIAFAYGTTTKAQRKRVSENVGDLPTVQPVTREQVAADWERARQASASRRGYEYLPSTPVQTCAVEIVEDTTATFHTVKFCAETARIALGLKQSSILQHYLPLHSHARKTKLQGFTYPEYYALMDEYGVPGTRQYHARILRQGRGIYWNIANGMIYPCGFVALSLRLVDIAHKRGLHDLYASGNHPGQRKDMYIRVSGSCAQFEGSVLASWYMAHNCPTISRWTLERLFARDRRSLWHIERYAAVTIVYNEAETHDPANVPLKADGSGNPRGDVYRTTDKSTGVITWHYRLANTYQVHNIRQHNRRGQSRRAVYAFKQWFESIPLHTKRQGSSVQILHIAVQVNSTGRIYCNDAKTAKRSRQRGNVGALYIRYKPGVAGRVVWQVDVKGISADM